MSALAIVAVTLLWRVPVQLAPDVTEWNSPTCRLPVAFEPDRAAEFKGGRVFVSKDRGKTWQRQATFKKGADTQILVKLPHDGEYWFALQLTRKNGDRTPAETTDLRPDVKLFMNTLKRPVTSGKPPENPGAAIEELRRTVERLEKRVRELEEKPR